MKKLLSIVPFVILINLPGFARVSNFEYFQLINQAELKITNSEFGKAVDLYDSAFRIEQFHFAQDLYNATLSALKAKRTASANQFALMLAEKGVGATFFEKNSNFRPLQANKSWRQLIDKAKKAKEHYRLSHGFIDNYIDNLLNIDKEANNAFFQSDMTGRKELRRNIIIDSISQVFLSLIVDSGYLSEDILGVAMKNDTTIASLPKFAPLIMNRSIKVNPAVDSVFKQKLMQMGVEKGYLKPEVYMYITRNSLNLQEVLLRSTFRWLDCSIYQPEEQIVRKAETYRRKIGACSLNDHLKKLLYVASKPTYGFCFSVFEEKENSKRETVTDISNFRRNYFKVADVKNCQ